MSVVLWVVVGVLVLLVVAAWSLILQLLRQQGRLLLRIEALERGVRGPVGPGPNGAPPPPKGIPPATAFPSFRLPDIDGDMVALEDFRGKRVLLVHWSVGCGFCRQIAPELAKLQGDLRTRKTELVLVAHGGGDENRRLAEEHGLHCSILLQGESGRVDAFTQLGTPVAYLLDEKGRVAKPLALGAIEVSELAEHAAGKRKRLGTERAISESRIEREGIPAGTPAPDFELPDLEGRTVSLSDYRGRQVLLVFSDPDCGPCEALACDLVRFHEEEGGDGLVVIMVSRGGIDENRRKAEEHGIEFPVVVQPGWKVSKDYGIFATPVAFLVDQAGVIAAEVAKGGPEILRLAREAARAGKEVTPA